MLLGTSSKMYGTKYIWKYRLGAHDDGGGDSLPPRGNRETYEESNVELVAGSNPQLGREALDPGVADVDAVQERHHVDDIQDGEDGEIQLPQQPFLGLWVDGEPVRRRGVVRVLLNILGGGMHLARELLWDGTLGSGHVECFLRSHCQLDVLVLLVLKATTTGERFSLIGRTTSHDDMTRGARDSDDQL